MMRCTRNGVPILREVLDALSFQPIETGVYDRAAGVYTCMHHNACMTGRVHHDVWL